MADDASGEQTPYVGPRPFRSTEDDRRRFFGRGREIEQVVSYIYSQPQLFLYAASGAGKTSLLNAGVVPELERANLQVLPTARVRGVAVDRRTTNPYLVNLLSSLAPENDRSALTQTSLQDFLAALDRPTGKRGMPCPRVLIIDQFEEILEVHSEDSFDHQVSFFGQLAASIAADPLLRIVLLVREDRIAPLEPFAPLLPDGLGTRFRLEPLTADAAFEAVVRPAEHSDRRYGPGVAEELVQRLLVTRAEVRPGEFSTVAGRFVEPVQLQVACEALWRRAGPGEITLEDLAKFGDVGRALGDHYEAALGHALRRSTVPDRSKVTERTLRAWFDERLITSVRTRGTVFQGPADTDGIPNDVVSSLEDEHIIRAERRAAGLWYELAHDTLIEPVLAANNAWRTKRKKLQRRRIVAAGFASFIVIVIASLSLLPGRSQPLALAAASPTCVAGTLVVEGSTIFVSVTAKIAESYEKHCEDSRIVIAGKPSFDALRDLARTPEAPIIVMYEGFTPGVTIPTVDASGQPIAAIPSVDASGQPIAAIPFAVVVNEATGISQLTLTQVRDIYQGRYTNWAQLGGRDQPINIIGRAPDSGTRRVFEYQVLKSIERLRVSSLDCLHGEGGLFDGTSVVYCERDSTVALLEEVDNIPGAIGYAELSAAPRFFNVGVVALDGVRPDIENIRGGEYGFWSVGTFYASDGSLVRAFLSYMESDTAISILQSFGYLPCTTTEIC